MQYLGHVRGCLGIVGGFVSGCYLLHVVHCSIWDMSGGFLEEQLGDLVDRRLVFTCTVQYLGHVRGCLGDGIGGFDKW